MHHDRVEVSVKVTADVSRIERQVLMHISQLNQRRRECLEVLPNTLEDDVSRLSVERQIVRCDLAIQKSEHAHSLLRVVVDLLREAEA